MSRSIAILGRGTSCTAFAEFSHLFNIIYIANTYDTEIDQIGAEHFKGKDLVHFQGKGYDHTLSTEHLALFRSVKVVQNTAEGIPDFMKKAGYPVTCPWEEILAIQHYDRDELRSEIEKRYEDRVAKFISTRPTCSGRSWPTIGMFAIEHALRDPKLNLSTVYLFGFDFYETGYVNGPAMTDKQTPIISSMMKYHLLNLMMEFDPTWFFMYTNGTFPIVAPNCTVSRSGKQILRNSS